MRKLYTILTVLSLLVLFATSCGPDCRPCGRVEFADPEKILFLGYEEIKVHGPVKGKHNFEDYQRMTVYKYLIDGHDYVYGYLTGTRADFGIIHLPPSACRKCKEESNMEKENYNKLIGDLENLVNSSSKYINKEELQTLLSRQERNIVKKFDDILDSWD